MAGQLHLWIGLLIAIPFLLIALSGALYTWSPELRALAYEPKVNVHDLPLVSIAEIKSTLARKFPEGDFRTVMYRGDSRAVQVLLYVPGTYFHAFMDPYSGALLHLQDMKKGWMHFILMLHRNLNLGDIGREMVHWVTLLATTMVLTGLILWWPRRRAQARRAFFLKKGVSLKRLNYDVHNVSGFYMCWIILLCLATGLFWGFEGVQNLLKVATKENAIRYDQPRSAPAAVVGSPLPMMDSLLTAAIKGHSDRYMRINYPHADEEALQVTLVDPGQYMRKTDIHYFDRNSGQALKGHFQYGEAASASTYEKLHAWVYDLHFGNFLGILGRLLVCIASLVFGLLPISGMIIWWLKWKKKWKRKSI